MKKLFTILLLMIAVCANAQHLKFMGIPIDGTITNFQAKLAQKGIRPDNAYNNYAKSPNSRKFTGIFSGYKASIFVYYNAKTKIVYRCKACISSEDKSYTDRLFNDMKYNLQNKYAGKYDEDKSEDKDPDIYKSYFMALTLGSIDLYAAKWSDYSTTYYDLFIDYYDYKNFDKNESKNSDDL